MVSCRPVGQAAVRPPVRLRLDRSWAKCPGNMAKHGQIMAMAPGQGDPQGSRQAPQAAARGASRAARAAWQAALGAPRPLPRAIYPLK